MLADVLSKLAVLLGAVSLYGVLAAALTWVTMSAARTPTRVLCQGLATYLYQARRRHYLDLGLYPRWSRLRRQVRYEATALLRQQALLSPPTDEGVLPRWLVIDTPWYRDEATLDRMVDKVFPDVREESREELCHGLRRLDLPLGKRIVFLNRLVTLLWSVALLVPFPLDALVFVSSSTTAAVDALRELWTTPALWPGTLAPSGQLVGMGITAVLATFVAGAALRPFMKAVDHAALPRPRKLPRPQPEPVAEKPRKAIGTSGCAVRALNFAGGAFDTVMQLGVAHALLVIQGRAPDAVVGVSAGALNAAALAEIIQAGEENERNFYEKKYGKKGWLKLDPEKRWEKLNDKDKKTLQQNRLLARTYRLRDFVAAAQRAPEALVDALVPDVYQIETARPLRPLDQPRFAPEERRQRKEAAIARSGLVRLYNDLLGIPFSVGTLTRLTRRILGILAASEIRATSKMGSWMARKFVVAVEILRIWVLLGLNLGKTAPLLAVLLRPFIRPMRRRTTTATAGALIFQFNIVRKIRRETAYLFYFFLSLVFWVGSSILPFEIAALITRTSDLHLLTTLSFTLILYALPLPLWWLFRGALRDFDRTTIGAAILEAARGTTAFLIATILWSALLTAILGPLLYLFERPIQWQTRWIDFGVSLLLLVGVLWLVMVITVVYLWLNGKLHDRPFVERLLASYNLDDALLREHGLRVYLVKLFDRDFYGGSDLDSAVERALEDELHGAERPRKAVKKKPKPISHYADSERRLEPIHVGVAVASTSTGFLDPVAPDQPVVKALLAAVSATPVFPAVELDGQLVVDGRNVANEPTRVLWGLLRNRVNEESKVVHIYSVSPFPVSSSGLSKAEESAREKPDSAPAEMASLPRERGKLGFYLNLVDVALRARRLQRFRDATLERKLTELFTRVIPPGTRVDVDTGSYYRAWVTPMELDSDLNFNRRILWAPKELQHQAIAETIADGCRAALQVMIPDAIEQAARADCDGNGLRIYEDRREWIAPCGAAVKQHLQSRRIGAVGDLPLPGSDARVGPGLKEICRHCRIWRRQLPNGDDENLRNAFRARNDASLRLGKWRQHGPPWPHEREYRKEALEDDPHFVPCDDERDKETARALEKLRARQQDTSKQASFDGQKVKVWPEKRGGKAGNQRPTVSLLFSGGVFRGVYQLGVLNALNDLGLEPDVIAGASVGSITAAMVAETFSLKDDSTRQQKTPNTKRCNRIRQLAAAYLAVDRLILTDRFADFIRDFTLRAAETRFSIRQADRLFRNYDYPAFREFDRNARRVVAGLERLLYLNPFQLTELIRNIRNHDLKGATLNLRELAQQFLDRMHVGDEVLGAEALEELIEHYVTGHRDTGHPVQLTFDDLRAQCGIQFLATATNLTEGRLEILGERPASGDEKRLNSPLLLEGLLASSAFPGVFRPRSSGALYPNSSAHHQYIDGGVMDNLPIDAVVQFLARAADAKLIARRPTNGDKPRPHLVVAVSLEVNVPPYDLAWTRRRLKRSWLALRRRAKELRYNRKLDTYTVAESKLRSIYEALHQHPKSADSPPEAGLEPVDLEVIAIKPEWLCGTFAFHPMLGFRRRKQAQSIAHGCAGTLLTFAATRADKARGLFLKDWDMTESRIPRVSSWTEAFRRWRQIKDSVSTGRCWLREGCDCPFSKKSLRRVGEKKQPDSPEKPLSGKTVEALSQIYEECIKFRTHVRTI